MSLLQEVKSLWRAVSPAASLAAIFVFAFIPQVFAQVPAHPRDLQVELLIQRADGKPASHLRARDFNITLDGRMLIPEVLRPQFGSPDSSAVPTRMLVILGAGPGSSPSMLHQLENALRSVWERGWQVGLIRSDGGVTDFATNAAQFLQIADGPPLAGIDADRAMMQMKFFRGRHVLLFLTGTADDHEVPSHALMKHVPWDSAETLIVDGGLPGEAYDLPGEHSGEPYSMQTFSSGYSGGAFHLTSARQAIRQALRDAAGFYELRFHVVPIAPGEPRPTLTITILKHGPLLVTSRLYPVSAKSPVLQVLSER